MRATTLVEAVVAVALGAGGGFGFLLGTHDLKSSSEVASLTREADDAERRLEQERQESLRRQEQLAHEAAEREHQALLAKAEAEARAKADADAKAAQAQAAKVAEANKGPAFGTLTIKALSGDLDVDGGIGLKGKGKTVDLAFDDQPGKVKVKAGKYTITMSPKPYGKVLALDVTVSPLAIVKANDVAMGTSASGLEVKKDAFKLDFNSPATGDVNLILQFKK